MAKLMQSSFNLHFLSLSLFLYFCYLLSKHLLLAVSVCMCMVYSINKELSDQYQPWWLQSLAQFDQHFERSSFDHHFISWFALSLYIFHSFSFCSLFFGSLSPSFCLIIRRFTFSLLLLMLLLMLFLLFLNYIGYW